MAGVVGSEDATEAGTQPEDDDRESLHRLCPTYAQVQHICTISTDARRVIAGQGIPAARLAYASSRSNYCSLTARNHPRDVNPWERGARAQDGAALRHVWMHILTPNQMQGARLILTRQNALQDINSPLRHVRTRIYFTSESHVHSLINVLRFCHLGTTIIIQIKSCIPFYHIRI